MSRDTDLYVRDMLDACRRIVAYRGAVTEAVAFGEGQTRDALLWNLLVLGEAAKQVPAHVTDTHPGIAWRKIAGFRDVLAHAYFDVDRLILRDVVDNKVPALIAQLEAVLDRS